MANIEAFSRTNYFRVKDAEAFKNAMGEFGDVDVNEREDGFFMLDTYASENGFWPTFIYNEDIGEENEIDFPKMVADHLIDDEVVIFMTVGHEKIRYVFGDAIAYNNKGEYTVISTSQIYDKAKKLGKNITVAEY